MTNANQENYQLASDSASQPPAIVVELCKIMPVGNISYTYATKARQELERYSAAAKAVDTCTKAFHESGADATKEELNEFTRFVKELDGQKSRALMNLASAVLSAFKKYSHTNELGEYRKLGTPEEIKRYRRAYEHMQQLQGTCQIRPEIKAVEIDGLDKILEEYRKTLDDEPLASGEK